MSICLSVKIDHRDPLNIPLEGLGYVHTVGVVGGSIWAFGRTETVNGSFTRYKWPDKAIKYPGSISISLSDMEYSTSPEEIETETLNNLETKIAQGFRDLKQIEGEAQKKIRSNSAPTVRRSSVYSAKVLIKGKPVFEISGEHIQFQVDGKGETNCKFSIYGRASSSESEPTGEYNVELSKNTELLIRLGS